MKNKKEVIEYINTLEGYEGYVQFSHRPIDIKKDVFISTSPKVEDESGFIYEAHFSNGVESIAVKQYNERWQVSKTSLVLDDIETFHAISDIKVIMAQIWENPSDELCEGMQITRLKKVVFAGFDKGVSQ